KDRADDPASGRFGVNDAEESSFAGPSERNGPARRDRKDRATALVGVLQGERAVFVHDGVRERSECGHERQLETRFDPNEVLQQADGAALVIPEESGPWGLLDVRAPSVEEVLPCLHAASGLPQLLHLVRQAPTFVFEPISPLRERRGLSVQLLDVPLDRLSLGFDRRHPLLNRREIRGQALTLSLGARERSLERLALRSPPGSLLPHPSAEVLNLPTVILLLPVRRLRSG